MVRNPFQHVLKTLSLSEVTSGHGESDIVIRTSDRDQMPLYFEVIKISLKEQISPCDRVSDLLDANNVYQEKERLANRKLKIALDALHNIGEVEHFPLDSVIKEGQFDSPAETYCARNA